MKRHSADWRLVLTALAVLLMVGLNVLLLQRGNSPTGLFGVDELGVAVSISACADLSTPDTTYTLTADVNVTGGCFNVSVSNVLLDCNNFLINYSQGGYGHGVNAVNASNFTVINCNIATPGSASSHGINITRSANARVLNNNLTINGSSSVGVYLENVTNGTVANNTINTTGSGGSKYGVYLLFDASNNTIITNNISTDGTSSSNIGIYLFTSTTGNRILNNTIITNGTSDNYGIAIQTNGYNNTIGNNSIRTGGSSGNNYGIRVRTTSSGNLLDRNIIIANGTTTNYGIDIGQTAGNTTISSNIIRTDGRSDFNHGMQIFISSNNVVVNNDILTNGTAQNKGIALENSARNNSIINNTIVTRGAGGNSGIYASDTISATLIAGNTILTSSFGSSSNNLGIYMQTNSDNFTIANNTIRTNGAAGTNDGILIFDNSRNNVVEGNIISTNGSALNNGIRIQQASNNNTFRNNNINTTGTGSYGILILQSNGTRFTNTVLNGTTAWIFAGPSTDPTFTNTTFLGPSTNVRITGQANATTTASQTINVSADKIVLGFPTVYVNATNLTFLNMSAVIIQTGVTFASPTLYVDQFDSGTFVQCTDCAYVSYDAGRFAYNVSHFTYYTTLDEQLATPVSCGIVNTNLTLTQNINSTTNCLRLNASNVVIDCNGYTTNYSQGSVGHAIVGVNMTNVTVQGCNIRNVQRADSHAVNLSESRGFILTNSTIAVDGSSASALLFTSVNTSIIANTSLNSTVQASATTVLMRGNSSYNVLVNNRIVTTANGIYLQTNASHNTVTNNTVRAFGAQGRAIALFSGANNNTFTRNNVFVNTTTDGYGFQLTDTNANQFHDNYVDVNATGAVNVGFYAATSSNTILNNNTLFASGPSLTNAISLYSANATNATNNVLRTNGTGNYGIFLEGTNATFRNTKINDTTRFTLDIASNSTFANTTFISRYTDVQYAGLINITGPFNVTHNTFILTNGSAYLNSTNNSQINVSAIVTFRNLTLTRARAIVDFDDLFSPIACPSNVCTPLSYRLGTFVFSVTHFTNFSVQEAPSLCGNLGGNLTMVGNTNSTGDCFVLNESNVLLDCDGYTINYSQDVSGHGIVINNTNNVTIRNCVIVTGTNLVNLSHAINVTNSSNVILENVSIISRGNQSAGIWVQNSTNVTINRSTIYTNGTGANSYGIRMDGHNNTMVGNTISTNGLWNTNYGITINTGSGNIVRSNSITTNGRGNNNGMFVQGTHLTIIGNTINSGGNNDSNDGLFASGIVGALIRDNIIVTSGALGNDGLIIYSGTVNSTITNNSVTTEGLLAANNGIFIGDGSEGNTISDNRVTTGGTSGNVGISLESSGNNTITGNVIRSNGTSSNHGIQLYSGLRNVNVTNNVIYTNGTSSNYGIYFTSTIRNVTAQNNTLITGGSGNNNDGINIDNTATNNTLRDNTIIVTTRGSGINLLGADRTNAILGTNFTGTTTDSYGITAQSTASGNISNTRLHQGSNWIFIAAGSTLSLTNTSFIGANSSIRYNQTLSLSGVLNVTRDRVRLANGSVAVNATNATQLNTSARVSIFNTPYRNPEAMLSVADDNTFIICPVAICQNQSAKDSNLTFTAAQFSNYSVQYHHSEVNITLNGDYNDISVARSTTVTIGATLNVGEGVVDLYMNDTVSNTEVLVASGYGSVTYTIFASYAPQNYTFRAVYAGNENFTANNDNATLVVYIPGGGGSIRPPVSCIEVWSCRSWTACFNNQQQRICDELNNCGTNFYQPALNQSCNATVVQLPSCGDRIQNQAETGVDCGGPCVACPLPASCFDGSQNAGETGVDCGGSCGACAVPVDEVPQPAPAPVAPVAPPLTQPTPAPTKSVAGVVATILGFIAVLGIVAGVVFKIMRRPPMGGAPRGGAPKTAPVAPEDESDLNIPEVE